MDVARSFSRDQMIPQVSHIYALNYGICHILAKEAPIAQLGEGQTLDGKVAGLILTRGVVVCP